MKPHNCFRGDYCVFYTCCSVRNTCMDIFHRSSSMLGMRLVREGGGMMSAKQYRGCLGFQSEVEWLGLLETDTMLSHVLGSDMSLMIERVLWGGSAMLKETFIIDWKHL